MTESAQIALLALTCLAIFIELAYIQRAKLKPVLLALHPREVYRVVLRPAGQLIGKLLAAVMPQALFNPAPQLDSDQLRALKRRTDAAKRQAKRT